METVHRRIGQLSTSIINKIAAGEVIERPASVLKELLENSVDAGATRIDVLLENGGLDRIRVSDNGCGIVPEDIPLAIASHATSKICSADDLFSVATLGFRGEALASIAEVSHLTLRTRVADSDVAHELSVYGGDVRPIEPCGAPIGTSIDVKNLFFNTPVRRKFLRGSSTELAHSTEAFFRIALAYPQIHFNLRHNDRSLHELPTVERWADRIAAMFGGDLAESLISVHSEEGGLSVSGYVANPTHNRGNNKMQYLFLNGRHIRDRALQHALGEAYRGLLLTGRHPIAFLRLDMPPDQIDVNVHPTKLEVRFQDSGRIYSRMLSTIRNRFLATDLTARVQPSELVAGVDEMSPIAADALQRIREQVSGHSVESLSSPDAVASPWTGRTQADLRFDRHHATEASPSVPPFRPFSDDKLAPAAAERMREGWSGPPRDYESNSRLDASSRHVVEDARRESPPTVLDDQPRARVLQAHNKYLVTTCDEGLLIIDQHALHERILYEQFRERVLGDRVEIQRMLVPEPVHLAPVEAATLLEHAEELARLGVLVESFGGQTVVLRGYPAMLGSIQSAEWLRQIAGLLLAGDRPLERRDLIDELLHMMACKAAIKTGDPLTPSEMDALLEYRHFVQDAHHCPHGRPTTLVFTREELDKRFKRI